MPLRQQEGDVVGRKQPGKHVAEGQYSDHARNAPECVDDPIAAQRHGDDEGAEQHDAHAVIQMQELAQGLTRQHAAAGGEAYVHQAHRHDGQDRAVDAELDPTGDHLRQAKLRALRGMQRHDRAADQLADQQRDQ